MYLREKWGYCRGYRQQGRFHRKNAEPCQDSLRITEEEEFRFYGLADGQTGAEASGEGGYAALQETEDWIREMGVKGLREYPYSDELPCLLMQRIRRRLREKSEGEGLPLEAYSSTLLAVGIAPESGQYVLLHLGDGCAVGVRQGEAAILSPPENGITGRHTWLTTSANAVCHLRIRFGSLEKLDRLLLFSDGADCFCRGKCLLHRELLSAGSAENLSRLLQAKNPADDASFLLVEKL